MNLTNNYSENVIQVTNYGITKISTGSDLSLSWPSIYSDNENSINSTVEIETTNSGLSIILPDATLGSLGYTFVVVNKGNETFNLIKKDLDVVYEMHPSNSIALYLSDNSTVNGEWGIIPFISGSTSISKIDVNQPESGLVITGSPVEGNGELSFQLNSMLLALESLSTNGILVKKDNSTIQTKSIIGDNNITVTNGSGTENGNISISLNQNLTGINSADIGYLQMQENKIFSTNTGIVKFNTSLGFDDGKGIVFYKAVNTSTFKTTLKGGEITENIEITLPVTNPTGDNKIVCSDAFGTLFYSEITGIPATADQMVSFEENYPIVPSKLPSSPVCYKAHGYCTVTGGAVTVESSLNLSPTNPVTRNSTGVYLVTLSRSFPSSYFNVSVSSSYLSDGNIPTIINFTPVNDSSFMINIFSALTKEPVDSSFCFSVLNKEDFL